MICCKAQTGEVTRNQDSIYSRSPLTHRSFPLTPLTKQTWIPQISTYRYFWIPKRVKENKVVKMGKFSKKRKHVKERGADSAEKKARPYDALVKENKAFTEYYKVCFSSFSFFF